MKMTKTKLAKGFTLVELLVVIAIIAALAALSTPVVLKQQKKAAAHEAVNNAKQQLSSCMNLTKTRSIPSALTPATGACRNSTQLQEVFHASQSILKKSSTPKLALA